MSVLPKAPYQKIMPVKSAELLKYANNIFLAQKVLFANCIYELSESIGADHKEIFEAMGNDPRITPSHLAIEDDGGRGAGGFCFIKDLAAFASFYKKTVPEDVCGSSIFTALEEKNIELLKKTGKDPELLLGVYGRERLQKDI
jgi:UDPglucose 6-dehydrogenase